MRIDLHIHSTASDGGESPRSIVDRAAEGGLDVIALTDHDTAAGVPVAVEAAEGRVRVIPAIEISALHRGRDLHILGYLVDPEHPGIVGYARAARTARESRVRTMIERLDGLGVRVAFEAVLEAAGPDVGALARPHLARAMVAEGHVSSIPEAFDRFIGDDGPAFVPTDLLDVPGAISLIRETGGVAVWAHPPMPLLGEPLRGFVEAGLDGLECYRPRVNTTDLGRLLNKARQHGLLVTGGSDWHGEWHGPLGSFHVGREEVGVFLDRGGI